MLPPEAALKTEYDVSSTTIRQALMAQCTEGLIVIRNGVGASASYGQLFVVEVPAAEEDTDRKVLIRRVVPIDATDGHAPDPDADPASLLAMPGRHRQAPYPLRPRPSAPAPKASNSPTASNWKRSRRSCQHDSGGLLDARTVTRARALRRPFARSEVTLG